ncbi:MAG: hypothetical protein EOP48_01885 [Sphingobacteriales bacterium]|nr:MAG: hypothetical protein EOP48_01885 [Sphingobacteriales bacterium]
MADTSCKPLLTGFPKRVYEKQKSNLMFFRRVLTFSDPSWATPPGFDRGSEKGSYILSADIQPVFAIGGEKLLTSS